MRQQLAIPRSRRVSNADHGIERVPWSILGPEFMRSWGWPNGKWNPEHLTVYGKSGGGKTYFVRYVLKQRAAVRGSHIVVVATKRDDDTIKGFGWPIIHDWPPGYGEKQVIFWARAKGLDDKYVAPQRAKVRELQNKLWVPGSNVVVYWDELAYIEEVLKLRTQARNYYREGRALGITNVASMQRPTGVTRLAHSEAGWTVAFPPKDQDDRKRVAEVFGDRARFGLVLDDLDRTKYEFLIRHDLTGEAYISSLPSAPSRGSGVSGRSARGVPSRHR
jgi:hypothetical protein